MIETQPGEWVTRSQAKAHKVVNDALSNSDFASRKWQTEQKIRNLPFPIRISIFLLICAAVLALFLGPFKQTAEWLFYS